MHHLRKLFGSISLTGVGLALEAILYCCYGSFANSPDVPGPQSLSEVSRVAAAAGLYARSDRHDGTVVHRLVVSDRPLDYLRANLLRFGLPEHYCWRGTVAVCYPARGHLANYDARCSTVWGEMFLYGDPEIIRRLTESQ